MTPWFEGADAKVTRAFGQVKALDADMRRFFETHQYGIGGQYDAEAREIRLWATALGGKFPSIEWGLQIGDCVHNLRSALDHVVWQLARLHLGREPTESEAPDIQFPIARRPRGFQNARVRPYLSAEHFGWLDGFQPYKSGDRARYHKLAILQRLSNVDKHRVVHSAAVIPESVDLIFADDSGIVSFESIELSIGTPLEPDTPMGVIRGVEVARPDPNVDAYGPIDFGVVLVDPNFPSIHNAPVIQLLTAVGEMADVVVSSIEAQFVPRKPRSPEGHSHPIS